MCDFNEEFQLLLNYPLMEIERSDEITYYNGIIRVEDSDYNVSIVAKSKLNRTTFSLKSPKLDYKSDSATILQCLDEIKKLLKTTGNRRDISQNYTNIYRRVLYEYSEFTRFHLNLKSCSLSDDLGRVTIETLDENNRQHSLEITIDYEANYDIFTPTSYDLPPEVCRDFVKSSNSLVTIYDQFLAILEQLQDFFNTMDTLDRNCYILEPAGQQRCHNYRRIWINDNLSVLVTIEPTNPRIRPDLKFLGPEHLVDTYRQRLNAKLEDWHDWEILTGILTILDLDSFPKKPEIDEAILYDSGECCMCFSLRLNGKIPEILCENQACRNCFHAHCLYEWLMSISAKRIFNQIHGQCPNCEKAISCPIPELHNS